MRQRLYAIGCGYPDANDASRLGSDPIHKLLCDRDPVKGEELASDALAVRELGRCGASCCICPRPASTATTGRSSLEPSALHPHSAVGLTPRPAESPARDSRRTPVAKISRLHRRGDQNRPNASAQAAKLPPCIDITPRHRETRTHGHQNQLVHA